MSDDYQLRKDVDELIDKVKRMDNDGTSEKINELDKTLHNQSSSMSYLSRDLEAYSDSLTSFGDELENYSDSLEDFEDDLRSYGVSLTGFSNDLTEFSGSLTDLRDSLVDFNGELIAFDENNQNLDSDLSKLKDNLHRFIVATNTLGSDLDALDSSLSKLDNDVFGANGLSSTLSALNNQINGSGGLAQTLNSFESQLNDLTSDNDNLLFTLNTLKGYLTTFQGTLSEFQAKIRRDLGDATYNKLNDEIIALFGAIASANNDISSVQDDVSDINDTIGDATNPANGTIRKNIQNVNATASTANTNINTVRKDLYGSNQNPNAPQAGSLKANLNQVKNTDVPAVQNILYGNGTKTNPQDGSLLADVYDAETGLEAAHDLIGDLDTTLNTPTTGLVAKTNKVINTVGDKDSGLVKLTNTLDGQTKDLNNKVGDDNSGLIKQTKDVQNQANGLRSDIGAWNSSNGTMTNVINNLKNQKLSATARIQNVLKEIFSPQINFTEILFSDGTPTIVALNRLRDSYGYDISGIQYAVNGTDMSFQFYRLSDQSWIPISGRVDADIGVVESWSSNTPTYPGQIVFRYMYSVSTNSYFKIREG